MNESDLTNAIVEFYREKGDSVSVEVPYNHYGDRGVVDLVIETDHTVTVYEIKSEYAVNNATGANDIIRQYNKQREYFARGTSMRLPRLKPVHHRLVFTATPANYNHVRGNWPMYCGVCESWDDDLTMTSMVELWHVETVPQKIRFTQKGDVYDFDSNRRVADVAGIEIDNYVEYTRECDE